MIQFFRLNDPFRIIGVFLILLLLRLPSLLNNLPVTVTELDWLLLGEAMADGKTLYEGVWDTTAPLSAGVYWLVVSLFGKTRVPFFIISILLVTFQAFIFNLYLNKTNLYNEKTYLPALLYALFMSMSFDFYTLSPVLMALTFLIFMMRNLFRLDEGAADREVFRAGVYLGIAVLFYLPSLFFLLMALMSFALFRTSSVRYLLLVLYGFFFVISLTLLYFFLQDRLLSFYQQYILSFISGGIPRFVSNLGLLWCAGLSLVALIYSILKTFAERGFINYQVSCQQIMFIWLISSFFTFLFNHQMATFQLIILVPALSFFGTHMLLLMRKRWLAEVYFWVFFSLMIGFSANSIYRFWDKLALIDYSKLLVEETQNAEKAQKILVLGKGHSPYLGNSIATPYLDWELAQRHFNHLDNYRILSEIYDNFQTETPELIIDNTSGKKVRLLFEKLPILADRYKRIGTNHYELLKE